MSFINGRFIEPGTVRINRLFIEAYAVVVALYKPRQLLPQRPVLLVKLLRNPPAIDWRGAMNAYFLLYRHFLFEVV